MDTFISIMNFLYCIIVGSPDLNYVVIDPIVGGALVSGAAGLIGSIFGHSSNSSTNKTNLRIARENREFYSEPAQMARMRESGINPYMAMSQVGGGVQQAAQMQPDTQTGQIIANTGQNFANIMFQQKQAEQMEQQNKLLAEQVEAQKLENFFNTAVQMDRIFGFRADSKMAGMRKYMFENKLPQLMSQIDFETSIKEYEANIQANNLRVSAINALIAEQFGVKREKLNYDVTYNVLMQGRAKVTNLLLEGQLTKGKILEVAANTAKILEEKYDIQHTRPYREGLMSSQAGYYDESATDMRETRPYRNKESVWRTENMKEENTGIWLRNNYFNQIYTYLIEGARESAENLHLHNGTYWSDNFFKNLGTVGSVGSSFGFGKSSGKSKSDPKKSITSPFGIESYSWE